MFKRLLLALALIAAPLSVSPALATGEGYKSYCADFKVKFYDGFNGGGASFTNTTANSPIYQPTCWRQDADLRDTNGGDFNDRIDSLYITNMPSCWRLELYPDIDFGNRYNAMVWFGGSYEDRILNLASDNFYSSYRFYKYC